MTSSTIGTTITYLTVNYIRQLPLSHFLWPLPLLLKMVMIYIMLSEMPILEVHGSQNYVKNERIYQEQLKNLRTSLISRLHLSMSTNYMAWEHVIGYFKTLDCRVIDISSKCQ